MSRAAWVGINFFYLEHAFKTQNKSCLVKRCLGACNTKYSQFKQQNTWFFFHCSNVCATRTSGVGCTPLLMPTMRHITSNIFLRFWRKNNVKCPVQGNLRCQGRHKATFVDLDWFKLHMEGSCLQQASALVRNCWYMMRRIRVLQKRKLNYGVLRVKAKIWLWGMP